MVRIEKLKKPDLQTVEMNCDNVISKRLLKYPMVQEAFSTTSFNILFLVVWVRENLTINYISKNCF